MKNILESCKEITKTFNWGTHEISCSKYVIILNNSTIKSAAQFKQVEQINTKQEHETKTMITDRNGSRLPSHITK